MKNSYQRIGTADLIIDMLDDGLHVDIQELSCALDMSIESIRKSLIALELDGIIDRKRSVRKFMYRLHTNRRELLVSEYWDKTRDSLLNEMYRTCFKKQLSSSQTI